MMLGRAAMLAAAFALGWVCQAQAQMPGQMPGPAVCNDFVPLRTAVENGARAIQAAGQRKAPPPEVCNLFRNFAAATAKMVKFMETNKTWCGVPDQAIAGAKANHAQAVKIRAQACKAAEAPRRPPAPSLSDALRSIDIATPENTTTGRGTFDTLTGNALAR